MYLKKLSANKEEFHSIEFKPGLNFIVGKRENPTEKKLGDTYNGVGKSLIIEIIHFCLGSKPIAVFEECLNDWIFTLEFEIDNEYIVVSRSCSSQGLVIVNGKEMRLKKYTSFLGEKIFGLNLENKIDGISFRSLISRFIRRYKSSYVKYDTYIKKEKPYNQLVNNAYLLGIDAYLIQNKMKFKKSIDEIKKTRKSIKDDPVLREYLVDKEDIDIEIIDLKDKIEELKNSLKEFNIAENYKEIQSKADQLTYEKNQLINERILIDNAIRKIDKSLNIKSEVQLESILKMYEEAKIVFQKDVVREISEVTNFHEKLLSSRKMRLNSQKQTFNNKKNEIDKKISEHSKKIDQMLKFLGDHGALDEYVVLNEQLNDLKLKLQKVNDYKSIIETYNEKLSSVSIEIEKSKLTANKYIKSNNILLEEIMNTFRGYSKAFYKDKASGLDIKVNDGDNQLMFDINAKIIGDSSDGISEVCMFCFDMTLLKLKNHKNNFIFHDSRLFANMDPRQRVSLLKIVEAETKSSSIQYITSINEDLILSLGDVVEVAEFERIKRLIEKNTILELTDSSDKDKLLGMTKDIPYDK
ncbi:MAG: DUF2326 domain-containing protein [Turicibacter sp.]|nr:DUF2326 domain-containing protein [Turicibacter sp.]